jgi:hypothetical protein
MGRFFKFGFIGGFDTEALTGHSERRAKPEVEESLYPSVILRLHRFAVSLRMTPLGKVYSNHKHPDKPQFKEPTE